MQSARQRSSLLHVGRRGLPADSRDWTTFAPAPWMAFSRW